MNRRINFLRSIVLVIVSLTCFSFLNAADSRSYPVIATYCDGSTLEVYPFSLVTRGDGSTFNCYEVLTSPITGGYQYGFEDKDDADYDDIVIELSITGNNTSSPVAHIKYVSKEASYKHWIYIVYNGTQQLVFQGENATPGSTFDIPLPVKDCGDFEINSDPRLRTINQGESTFYTVTVKAIDGFSKDVNLSVEGLPTGATGVFRPNPLPVTGEAKLDIATIAGVVPGTYSLTIKGTAGEKTRSAEVTLEIRGTAPEPDFELSADPGLRTIDQGETTFYTVTVKALNGFSADVNLSVEGLPTGVTGVFQPNPLPVTGEAKLEITTTAETVPGTYVFTIKGTAGEKTRSTQVTLEIREKAPEPDFTLEAEPKEQILYPGESVDFDLFLTSINNFSSQVQLYIGDLPKGVTGSFQPGIVKPTAQAKLTIGTSTGTPVGSYTIKVTAKGGGIIRLQKLTLTVKEIPVEPEFEIKAAPALQTLYRGETAAYTVTLTAINGFAKEVTLDVSGVPAGTAASFDKTSVTPDGEAKLQVTTTANTPLGDHVLTITGRGGEKEHAATVKLSVQCRDFSVKISAEPLKGPAPLTVLFSGSAESNNGTGNATYRYSWNFGDGTTSNDQNPEHTYPVPGTYQAVLSVSDDCGKSKTATTAIEVIGFEGAISKSFSVSEAQPGDEVFITIEIKNETRFNFNNVTVSDELSPYLEYLEDDAVTRPQRSGQELVWRFQTLEKGETLRLNVKVNVAANAPGGTITNVAFLSHDSLGQGKRLTSNTASLLVRHVDILLQKIVEQTKAKPGELIKYQLIIKNNSDIPLTGIKLTDQLDDHLEFDYQDGKLEFQRQGRFLQWTGTIEAQQQEVITLKARARQETFSGTRIQNQARLEAAELKAAMDSNTVETLISSEPISTTTVQFTKHSEVPQTEVGRIIRFSLTIANMSTSGLMNPVVEDYLPQGFAYVANTTLLNNRVFTEPQGTRRLLWQLPYIKPGETLVIRYQVVIGTDAKRGLNINRAVLRTLDNSGQDITLEATAGVNVSSSGFIFYSGVEGTVYLDRDDDDFYSMADTPLQGIEVRLSTGEKAFTDSLGNYAFESLFPGEYAVGVNTATLPERYKLASPYPKVVVLADGLTDTVDFAVKFQGEEEEKPARLEGRVFFDKNQDQVFNGDDPLCEEFNANLDGLAVTNGSNGMFVFTHLEPGVHTMEISYNQGTKTIKKEITLNKGNNQVDIPLRFTGIKIIIKSEEK